MPVGLTGVQHLGSNFAIGEFYVNGYYGGNVGREGGGGSEVCCIRLPQKWRPGLVAEIRWSVGDWSNENPMETNEGNYRSVTWTAFRAVVPVEKYEEEGHLNVHFFKDGRVRAVSSNYGAESTLHPIKPDSPYEAEFATAGEAISKIFTDD